MNNKGKGRRSEYKARKILEEMGYSVMRSAASLGAFDLCGITSGHFLLVQVKTNEKPRKAEMDRLKNFSCPQNCYKAVFIFKDYAREPEIIQIWGDERLHD